MRRIFNIFALIVAAVVIAGQSAYSVDLTFAPGVYGAANNYGKDLKSAEVWRLADGKITIAYKQDGRPALGSFCLENFDSASQEAILKALKLTRDDFDKKVTQDRLAADQKEQEAAAARLTQPKQAPPAAVITNVNTSHAVAHVTTKQASDPAMPITESTFLNPTNWANNAMPGNWKSMSVAPKSKILKLRDRCSAFGYTPQAVHAYYDGETLQSVEIVFIEQGKSIEEMRMDQSVFEARINDMSKKLPYALGSYFGGEGQVRYQGHNTVLSTKMLEWYSGSNVLRLEMVPGQVISLHILPASENQTYSFMLAAVVNMGCYERAADANANVVSDAKGDVIISNLPMVEQGSRGYCAVGVLAMLSQYYGVLLSIDSMSAKARYQSNAAHQDCYSGMDTIYQSVAQEAKLAIQPADAPDFRAIQRYIDKGCPVIVWRKFNEQRNAMHSAFAIAFKADPTMIMPIPANLAALQWSGHASIINGYNKVRDEVIFTESWGENVRNRRMRFEELQATASKLFYFEPKE
jgi:hypothetical protein